MGGKEWEGEKGRGGWLSEGVRGRGSDVYALPVHLTRTPHLYTSSIHLTPHPYTLPAHLYTLPTRVTLIVWLNGRGNFEIIAEEMASTRFRVVHWRLGEG